MAVVQRGTDSSGRPILATEECWSAFDAVCDVLGFVPTIVQGGHLKNAASASADTHAGDAFDLRVWDRTAAERAAMVRTFRLHAFAYWERTQAQGFDPHAHMVPGPWASPSSMALDQWRDYLAGRNGLKSHAADDGWRPDPLVLTPPEDDMNPAQEARLANLEQAVDRIEATLTTILRAVRNKGENAWKRDVDLKALVKEVLAEARKP